MLWSNFQLEWTKSDDRECDLLVTDEREGVDQWRVWEAEDDNSVLFLEDWADEEVLDCLLEQDG